MRPRASYEFAVQVLRAPEVVAVRRFKTRERVVWNLATVIEHVVQRVFSRDAVSDKERMEVLRLSPAFLHRVYEDDEWSESAYMWWDGIVGRPDPGD